jgi:hypothetical protein
MRRAEDIQYRLPRHEVILLNRVNVDKHNDTKDTTSLCLLHGLFFFTHKAAGCFSTMALETGDFLDIYKGKKYAERKAGSAECPGYCRDRKELRRCDAMCEGAVVREIIQIISERKKK